MKIIGKVHKVLDPIEGQTQNGSWIRRTLVVQMTDSDRKVAVDFRTPEWVEYLGKLKTGDMVEIQCAPESRPSTIDDSMWFTNIKGWGIKSYTAA